MKIIIFFLSFFSSQKVKIIRYSNKDFFQKVKLVMKIYSILNQIESFLKMFF